MSNKDRQFTLEEVAKNNGCEGRPMYIVFENIVYDVTESPMWQNGSHMRMHQAGADLTDQLAAAPHFAEVFTKKRVKKVGVLRPDQGGADIPKFLKTLFRFFPMLRRHPHPMSVHFPTAYLVTAALFLILDLVLGEAIQLKLDAFVFLLLILGTLSAVFSMATGFLTLWVNYRFKKTSLVRWKIRLAVALLITGLAAIIIRSIGLVNLAFFGLIYNILIFVLALLVMGLGYLGGQMVFPTKVR